MHINLEAADIHSIQSYSDREIQVNSQTYQNSLIISNQAIITDWPVTSIQQLKEENLEPLLRSIPKIIIIGHQQAGQFASPSVMAELAQRRIGLEVMSIGAACRTFNILLNEHREVVIGIIL
jgi:uncharacterized protein